MSSIRLSDPRVRATWRWGGAIAGLLVVQSIMLAALFWLLATGSHQREAERGFVEDCRALADLDASAPRSQLRAMLTRDIHRDRFLVLFAKDGTLIAGNVARLPPTISAAKSFVAPVEPVELPGKDSDVARVAICPMPDGTQLLAGHRGVLRWPRQHDRAYQPYS